MMMNLVEILRQREVTKIDEYFYVEVVSTTEITYFS